MSGPCWIVAWGSEVLVPYRFGIRLLSGVVRSSGEEKSDLIWGEVVALVGLFLFKFLESIELSSLQ